MENKAWYIAHHMTDASEDLGTLSVSISLGTYGNKVVEVRKGVMGV